MDDFLFFSLTQGMVLFIYVTSLGSTIIYSQYLDSKSTNRSLFSIHTTTSVFYISLSCFLQIKNILFFKHPLKLKENQIVSNNISLIVWIGSISHWFMSESKLLIQKNEHFVQTPRLIQWNCSIPLVFSTIFFKSEKIINISTIIPIQFSTVLGSIPSIFTIEESYIAYIYANSVIIFFVGLLYIGRSIYLDNKYTRVYIAIFTLMSLTVITHFLGIFHIINFVEEDIIHVFLDILITILCFSFSMDTAYHDDKHLSFDECYCCCNEYDVILEVYRPSSDKQCHTLKKQ